MLRIFVQAKRIRSKKINSNHSKFVQNSAKKMINCEPLEKNKCSVDVDPHSLYLTAFLLFQNFSLEIL